MDKKLFCQSGGCSAKLGAGLLRHVLEKLPAFDDKNLLVGYDGSDDGAVYKLTDDIAIVQTLDFFPPMVEDPYIFGQIAAANALSDVYAMGGEVKTALNIVCFPENQDLNILGTIMQGGSDKVREAGGVLAGGHSIADKDIKYGLSVTGIIHPDKILANNTPQDGDVLVLTKPLGVGIVTTANRVKQASEDAVQKAISSMTTLNKYAMEKLKKYRIHACTDVTGFGLSGHLLEMTGDKYQAEIHASKLPVIKEAIDYADEFLTTGGGQKNRNYAGDKILFNDVPFALEEIIFDHQTSGGILAAVHRDDAEAVSREFPIIGVIRERKDSEIKIIVNR